MFDDDLTASHPRWKSGDVPVFSLARGAPTSPPPGKSSPQDQPRHPASSPSRRSVFQLAERLAQIWLANEHELASLTRLRQQRLQVRAYAARPRANEVLTQALLERIDAEIRRACARLGANDRETRSLLAKLGYRQVYWNDPGIPGEPPVHQRRRSG